MTYHRERYAQLPIRSMSGLGSPDGLGAYFQNRYTQPISPAGGGASVVAQYQAIQGLGAYFQSRYTQPISPAGGGASVVAAYQPINGLGCACAAGVGADAAPTPSLLSNFWVKAALAVGVVAVAYYTVPSFRKLWGKGGAFAANGRRHRKNGRWSRKAKNSLGDNAFLYVAPGGSARIENGHKVTVPRSLRKFPYRNRDGSVNLAHLRNAIARIPQSNIPASLKGPLQAKARSILAEHGGYKRARRAAGGVLKQAA